MEIKVKFLVDIDIDCIKVVLVNLEGLSSSLIPLVSTGKEKKDKKRRAMFLGEHLLPYT